jgi:putative ABC transport system permease protein
MDALLLDLRVAWRALRRSPAFSAAVIATMALGTGATASMFTLVNSIVLRPLPFPQSDRVVALCETSPRVEGWCVASPVNVADWAAQASTLESAGVARTESFIARGDDGAEGVRGAIASPGFFRVLRARPAFGRLFEDRDMNRGANAVALVSHGFWQRTLGGTPAAIGRTVDLDGRAVTVIGILPADAYIPDLGWVDVWKPLTASIDDVDNRNWRGFTAIGRLAARRSLADLQGELGVIGARLAAAYPDSNAGWGIRAVPLRDQIVGSTAATLWIFLGATTLVLLIACANVAGLLLVRAAGRAPEFAVRASLGAGGRRLAAQLLTEAAVFSTAGGALGLLIASWTTTLLVGMAPEYIPRLDEVALDARVVLATVLVSAATAAVFGLAPARQASRSDLESFLKGRRHAGGGGTRLRSALVVAQIALALILLAGAGLLTKAFGRIAQREPGFARHEVVTSWMLAPSSTYPVGTAAVAVLERAREAVAALPGLRSVALGSGGPLFGGVETGTMSVEGRPEGDASDAPPVNWFDVSPEYFEALGVPVVRGRGITPADASGAPNVAVVNQTLAARFFAGADPIGQRVTVGEHTSQIVGVVGDVRPYRPDRPTPSEIYWPIRQYPRLAAYLVMRTGPGVEVPERLLRARVATVDPSLQITPVVRLDENFSQALMSPRFNALLIGAFAFVAVALAAVGVFAVVAYSVATRTREIGIRLALGAAPRQVVAGVVRQGLTLAALGIGIGLAGAVVMGRAISSLLYGLEPTDAATFAATLLGVGLIAAGATYLPARRAARVDPMTALRQD